MVSGIDPEQEDELIQASRRGKKSTVERLLRAGIRTECIDKVTGRTPLLCAAARGESGCVDALLRASGYDGPLLNGDPVVSMVQPFGKECPKAFLQTITFLLQANIDVHATNAAGRTAMDLTKDEDVAVRALLDPVLRAKTERRDSAEEAHTDAQPSPASASAQALLDAMPSKPPKDMVPLGLPHPSASVHLCPQLWERCKEAPDSTARKTLMLLDEVLGDLCMDNLEPRDFDALEESAGKPTFLFYVRALQREGVTVPSTLLGKLNTLGDMAGVVARFPAALKVTEAGARDLIMLLSGVLEWVTEGAIARLDVTAAEQPMRKPTGFVL